MPSERVTHEQRDDFRLVFLRAIDFPAFPVEKGEVWECDSTKAGTAKAYFDALESGDDRFPFGGGQCLLKDVVPLDKLIAEVERLRGALSKIAAAQCVNECGPCDGKAVICPTCLARKTLEAE